MGSLSFPSMDIVGQRSQSTFGLRLAGGESLCELPDVTFVAACLALPGWRLALVLDLAGDVQNGRITQPAMAFCRVIAIPYFELLQEPNQAYWPQIPRQRL